MVVKHFLLMLMMNSKLLLFRSENAPVLFFCTGGQAMGHDFPLQSSAMQAKYLEYVGSCWNMLEYI
jgi:hypothetical protein